MARFVVNLSYDAEEDLAHYRAYERKVILEGALAMLGDTPTVETKERKRLRSNLTAPWEGKVGNIGCFMPLITKDHGLLLFRLGIKSIMSSIFGER